MGDDAVLALVRAAGRDHDHLALGLGQVARLVHQRVVVGEERAELVRPVREDQEHVRDEAGLLLDGERAVRGYPPACLTGREQESG